MPRSMTCKQVRHEQCNRAGNEGDSFPLEGEGWGGAAVQAIGRRRQDLQFLPAALEVLDTPASPAGRAVAATISLFLLGALAWSIIGQVDIVATAQGVVIPVGKSKIVQPWKPAWCGPSW